MMGKESQKDYDIRDDDKPQMMTATSHGDNKDLLTLKCGEFDSFTCSKAGKKEFFFLVQSHSSLMKTFFCLFLPWSLTMLLTQAFCFMLFTFALCVLFLKDVQDLFISANLTLSLHK